MKKNSWNDILSKLNITNPLDVLRVFPSRYESLNPTDLSFPLEDQAKVVCFGKLISIKGAQHGRFLFVEAVRELDVVFPLAVLHAVSQVAAGKPLGVEVGSRHAADPHAEALEFVRTERRIHRTEVELARLAVFPRRNVSGDKNLGRFDDDVEDGHFPHLRQQIIKGAFLLTEGNMAVLHPEGIGTSHGTLRHMDFAQEIEDGIALGDLEFVFIVVSQVVGIELLRPLDDVEVDVGVLGIKVWICNGEVYGKRDLSPNAGVAANAQAQGQSRGGRDRRRGGDRRRERRDSK